MTKREAGHLLVITGALGVVLACFYHNIPTIIVTFLVTLAGASLLTDREG